MKTELRYVITSMTKKQTERGANYFDMQVVDTADGQVINCTYFGNTTPKRVTKITERVTPEATYYIAEIQPHTSRDKKTGRFICARACT